MTSIIFGTGTVSLISFVLAVGSLAAQEIACTLAAAPDEVVEGREFTVTVAYAIPAARGAVKLHAELKNTQHVVLRGEVAEVAGTGERTFTLTAPSAKETPEILIAVWLGEQWQEALAPIQQTEAIRVRTTEAFAQRQRYEQEAGPTLQRLGYARSPRGNVALLKDALPGFDDALADRLAQALQRTGASVTVLDAAALANPFVLSIEHFDLLALAHPRTFPGDALDSLERFLRDGGDLIVLGGPAFERIVWNYEGRWLDREGFIDLLSQTELENKLFDFEAPVDEWTRGSNTPPSEGEGRGGTLVETTTQGGHGSGKALHVRIPHLTGWDTVASPPLEQPFPAGHSLTCFWARGTKQTTQLALEWQERDGSRWIATVALEPRWKYFVLPPESFAYWHDNPSQGRGGANDCFRPANAARFSVGLAFTHTQAIGSGPHEYWLDDLGTAPDPRSEKDRAVFFQPPRLPVLDTISPSYKLFEVTDLRSIRFHPSQALVARAKLPRPAATFAVHPRPQGTGYHKQRKWRWIPLVEALDRLGRPCGTLATLLFHRTPPYRGGVWLSLPVADRRFLRSEAVLHLVTEAAQRMLDGVFLAEGGAEWYACFDGEAIRLGAEVVNLGRQPAEGLHVRLRVAAEGGLRRVFERTFDVSVAPGASQTVEAVWDPGRFARDEYQVKVELRRGGPVIDRLVHDLGVWRPSASPAFITTRDGDFRLQGKRWFPHGVNYMPSSGMGIEEGEYFEYWLDPQPYDPEVIERDLQDIEGMGMNMVSVFIYYRSVNSRNLLDLLRRCERHHLKVNLSLRPGTPLDFRWDEMREIITSYRLPENDTVFAYDLAWEPAHGGYEGRKRWDREWEAWIVERYGSVANAEQDWGFPVPRAEGQITGPSDTQVSQDGDHRRMVAAYRRFLDDLLNRKYGDATRLVKGVDPHHLVSFRMSIAGDPTVGPAAMAYDFVGLAQAVDILCPEGYGRIGDWERVKPGHFTVAYARFAAPDTPVMWAEFGYSVWDGGRMTQSEEGLKFAGQFYTDFYRMVEESGANGSVCWWFPGGYRWNERSDYGIRSPDRTYRPTSHVIQDWASRLTQRPRRPRPDVWIEIDRDAHPAGLYGIYEAVQDEYWRAIAEGHVPGLRTAGTGTDSATTPLVAVGNTPYNGSNPPKYLNAACHFLQLKNADGAWVDVQDGSVVEVAPGQPVEVRASIGNTGEAAWLSPVGREDQTGTVYLSSRREPGLSFQQPIPRDVPSLGDAELPPFVLAEAITEPVEVAFEMTAQGRAWFGEKVEVTVQPKGTTRN